MLESMNIFGNYIAYETVHFCSQHVMSRNSQRRLNNELKFCPSAHLHHPTFNSSCASIFASSASSCFASNFASIFAWQKRVRFKLSESLALHKLSVQDQVCVSVCVCVRQACNEFLGGQNEYEYIGIGLCFCLLFRSFSLLLFQISVNSWLVPDNKGSEASYSNEKFGLELEFPSDCCPNRFKLW